MNAKDLLLHFAKVVPDFGYIETPEDEDELNEYLELMFGNAISIERGHIATNAIYLYAYNDVSGINPLEGVEDAVIYCECYGEYILLTSVN